MRKVLVNAYLALNFGDDLFLKILFDRYPNINWVLSLGGKGYRQVFKGYNNVIIKDNLFYRFLAKLGRVEKYNIFNKYDAAIYIGGSIFIQLPEWKEQYLEREKVITSFVKNKKPVFIVGSNFGPYTNKEYIDKYRDLLKCCEDVCFREKYSYDLFKELNNVRINPDIVFQLKHKNIEKTKSTLGISVIYLLDREGLKEYWELYKFKIKEIAECAINEGKTVTFFSFCEAQGDMKAINEIISIINKNYSDYIKVENYEGNIDGFLMEFSAMENIVGTRFHACILSQVFNQGLYPIIYSDKTYNVLKGIELNNHYSYIKDLEEIDAKNILKIMTINKIKDVKVFKEAEKQFKELDRYVEIGE